MVKYRYCPKCDDARKVPVYESKNICKVCGSKGVVVKVSTSEIGIMSFFVAIIGFIIMLAGIYANSQPHYVWQTAGYQATIVGGVVIMMIGMLVSFFGNAQEKEKAIELGRKLAKTKKPSKSIADEIKKLAELKDAGTITEKEFQVKKKKLLAKI